MLSHDQNVPDEGLVAEGPSGQSSLECLRGNSCQSNKRAPASGQTKQRFIRGIKIPANEIVDINCCVILAYMYSFCIIVISIKLNVMKIMIVLAPTVYFLKIRHKHVLLSLILHLRISMYYIFIIPVCSLPERESPERPTQR